MIKTHRRFRRKFRNWKVFLDDTNLKTVTKKPNRYYSLGIPLTSIIRKFTDKERRRPKLKPAVLLFDKIFENAKQACRTYDKNGNIFKILNTILPNECFGSKRHRKVFYKIVKLIMSRAVHECILRAGLVKGYEFQKIPWLDNFNYSRKIWNTYLYYGIIWLLDGIVKPLIKFNYYCLKAGYAHEIQYIPYHLWNSFEHKIIDKIIKLNYVSNVDRSLISKVRGVLQFIPKNGLKDVDHFRPILRLYKRRQTKNSRYTGAIFHQARLLSGEITGSLSSVWSKYLKSVEGSQIFGVKLDVTDAYGNIDIERLVGVIKNVHSWCAEMKSFLTNHIRGQYIVFKYQKYQKPQIYKWNHGLLQGDTLSGPLCELYMSHFDKIHLSDMYKEHCFIHRTVDDYLFCSTEKRDVEKFIAIVKGAHHINGAKTQGNIGELRDTSISYCGRFINLDTGEITANNYFYPKKSIHYKFKIWNIKYPVLHEDFLARAMRYGFNNYHFQIMLLNVKINSDQAILKNFFHGMLVLAFKFDVAVMAIYNPKNYCLYGNMLGQTVWKYARKGFRTIQKSSDSHKKTNITFGMLLKVGYSAFHLVLSRRNTKYKLILSHIKDVQKNIFVNTTFDMGQFKTLPQEFYRICKIHVY